MTHPQTNFSSNFQGVDPPLEGYWHDDPIPCGGGNVVTDIRPNPAGVPVVVKGFNALTAEDIADKLDKTGNASNTTSAFTKATGDTSTMTSGSKLSVIFTAISSFFASLKALAFKDKASYNDLSSGVQSSLDKADSALQSHQSVTDNNPTLSWGTTSKVGTVGNTDLRVTMPENPATDKQRNQLDIYGDTDKFIKLFKVSKFTAGSSIGTTVELIGRAGGSAVRVVINIKGLITADYIQFYDFEGDTSHNFTLYVAQDPDNSSKNLVYAFLTKYGSLYVNASDTSAGDTDLDFSVFGDVMSGRISGDTAITLRNMRDASWINSGTFDAARIPAVGLKSNTATLYISGYHNNTPIYHVKDIKNGCVNYVHVKDTLSSSCNLTIEAPALAAGEEYDYVVVFDTFTNNNLVGNIDVENCKTTGHFESGVFVHDTMAILSTAPSQVPMIIVTGNVARPQWYDRT